nr:hypothetical protein [Luteitalea pratensis]
MAHAGNCACFSLETIELCVIDCTCRRQDLDRDGSIEARITRAIDLSHATGAKSGDDFVGADPRAGVQAHGSWTGWSIGRFDVELRFWDRALQPVDLKVDGYKKNAERRTPNAERRTPNAERRTPNTGDLAMCGRRACSTLGGVHESPICDPRYPVPGTRYPVPGPGARNPVPVTRYPEPGFLRSVIVVIVRCVS